MIAVAGGCAGALVATKGHPFAFISRQWNGFVHASTETVSTSNFGVVGSGRYDFWRVAIDAFLAHPIGGLGQDNFDNYYVVHRRINQEPAWTHSLEMRLLAHTGIVGFALFSVFIVAAVMASLRARRRTDDDGDLTAAMAGAALLPLVVWLIHGSIDWFWEMPALSGPALGFLGMAGALGRPVSHEHPDAGLRPVSERTSRLAARRAVAGTIGVLALLGAVIVLGFPHPRCARCRSPAICARRTRPGPSDLDKAADLNPRSADPAGSAGPSPCKPGSTARPCVASSSRSRVTRAGGTPGSALGWPRRPWTIAASPATTSRWPARSTRGSRPFRKRWSA